MVAAVAVVDDDGGGGRAGGSRSPGWERDLRVEDDERCIVLGQVPAVRMPVVVGFAHEG